MNVSGAILIALSLLQAALEAAKSGTVAEDVVKNLEAAVSALLSVQGTDVTFGQLEGLRVQPKW